MRSMPSYPKGTAATVAAASAAAAATATATAAAAAAAAARITVGAYERAPMGITAVLTRARTRPTTSRARVMRMGMAREGAKHWPTA